MLGSRGLLWALLQELSILRETPLVGKRALQEEQEVVREQGKAWEERSERRPGERCTVSQICGSGSKLTPAKWG